MFVIVFPRFELEDLVVIVMVILMLLVIVEVNVLDLHIASVKCICGWNLYVIRW